MRILQVGKFYPIRGGVEKVMWDLTKGISARGIDCDMLCAKLPGDGIDAADAGYADADGKGLTFNGHGHVAFAKAYAKVAATMMSPAMVFKLRSMLRRAAREGRPYDVVHVHHPDPMACVALWLSGYKGKVILHWHSDILKQKGLLKLYMPLQRWLIRRADRIVGTTPVYVAQSPYLKDVQEKCTYLPIGTEGIPRVEVAAGEKKIVYSMGRLVEYKGYRYLAEAAKYLPENYEVVIGGGGPLKDELQAQIDSQKAENDALKAAGKPGFADVRLLGRVPDEDVAKWYNSCEVFVLSSVMKTEAFGIVQIEAMSCGKPVVATKIPGSGTAWVNEDGVSGINVEICDAKAIADAVLSIEADYAKFSAGARKRYEEVYTYEGMIDKCLAIYEA